MSASGDNRPIATSAAQGRRIAAAVKTIENGYGTKPAAKNAALWNPGIARALVTTAIPTGTFASPSTAGRAQLYHKDSTGTYVPSGDPVVVKNQHSLAASYAVGKPALLGWVDGDWFLMTVDC